ncbi:hypothetical protein DEMA109039_12410 [Deinococcus marmoris]
MTKRSLPALTFALCTLGSACARIIEAGGLRIHA